jgi:nucleolar protein 14
LNGDDAGEQAKLDLMSLSLELVGRCADMYKPLDGFIELYAPVLTIVGNLPGEKLPAATAQQISQLSDKISRLLKFARQARQPLLLQSHKPIPIATYIPKFDAHSSSYMRNKDPNAEREALAKLKAQHRKEKKGAIRELRKDNRFLAGVQQERQEAKDREYKARMSKAFAGLESERAEQKKEDNEKRREKRRSGRK